MCISLPKGKHLFCQFNSFTLFFESLSDCLKNIRNKKFIRFKHHVITVAQLGSSHRGGGGVLTSLPFLLKILPFYGRACSYAPSNSYATVYYVLFSYFIFSFKYSCRLLQQYYPPIIFFPRTSLRFINFRLVPSSSFLSCNWH